MCQHVEVLQGPNVCFFSLEIGVQERLGGLNLLKYLHLVGSLKYCRVQPRLGKTMGRQLGLPCPAQKRRWLPIVCRVKSKCQAWNSSAGTIGPALPIGPYRWRRPPARPGPAPPHQNLKTHTCLVHRPALCPSLLSPFSSPLS